MANTSKTFVLDTGVLLYDPHCIFRFAENTVCIPLVVIEELDHFKRNQSENGRNARMFARLVDELRLKGSLAGGVDLDEGGKLFVHTDYSPKLKEKYSNQLDLSINDNKILLSALDMRERGDKVVLVTKDINLRVKGDAVGLISEDYGKKNRSTDEMYTGISMHGVSMERLNSFEKNRFLEFTEDELKEFNANEYIILHEENNPNHRHLGRYSKAKKGLVPLVKFREGVWGIHAKNMEQQFALDALLNNEVRIVSLVGKAGTGKTLLAIAAGLEMTIGKEDYQRVLVSRPIQPMGRDLGFLPGDVNEKLGPCMQPIFDNIDFLFGAKNKSNNSWEELITQGLLHVEPLTYIRGRSIPGQYLIVDEAQNLSPHEIKTIITRAGEGTKIVLTGDVEQIDSPYLDSVSNGLAYCVERLKGEDVMSHVALKVGERSSLAEIASKLL